jgi:hypothetical protein
MRAGTAGPRQPAGAGEGVTHPSCRVVKRIRQDFRGFAVSGEDGDPCAGGHGRDRIRIAFKETFIPF